MIHTLFSTYVYQARLLPKNSILEKQFRKTFTNEIYRIEEIDKVGRDWCKANYQGGYTSYSSYDKLFFTSSSFDELRVQIDRHIKKFIQHSEMNIKLSDLKMTHCWVNIMPKGVHHSMHIHPLSVISGTYYVSTPRGSGALKIEDPRHEQFMNSPSRKKNARKENVRHFKVEPGEGEVVLFESWTRHEVMANQASSDRISISFNYGWK